MAIYYQWAAQRLFEAVYAINAAQVLEGLASLPRGYWNARCFTLVLSLKSLSFQCNKLINEPRT